MDRQRRRTETVKDMQRALLDEVQPDAKQVNKVFTHLPIARPDVDWIERPRTRAECRDMPRPCPFVRCEHHAMLEVDPGTGHLHFPYGTDDIDELPYTCTLDESERGGMTLDAVGQRLGITRERVRQIETMGLIKIRRAGGSELGLPADREERAGRRTLPAASCP